MSSTEDMREFLLPHNPMLIEVHRFECTFLGMPLGREPSIGGKKGKLIRDPNPVTFGDVGDLDGKEDSPTYGKKACVVGKTYTLDQWQWNRYGGAFEKGKEVKGYVIDDGRTDEVEALARKKYKQEQVDRVAKEASDVKKAHEKAEADRIADEKKKKDEAIKEKEEKQKEIAKEEKKKK